MITIPLMTRREQSSGNPGDVFIGWGLKYLISKVIKSPNFLLLDKFSEVDFKLHERLIKKAGFVIYAGTPQYNRYSDWCFWYDWDVYKNYVIPWKLNFYPLAGGSGGDVAMTPDEFSKSCCADKLTQEIMEARRKVSKLTTVRDLHSYKLLQDMKWKNISLMPCTALWSGQYTNLPITEGNEVILVPPNHHQVPPSYFGVSNHEEVGTRVKALFLTLAKELKLAGKKPIILCHGHKEFKSYSNIENAIYTNDINGLMAVYARSEGVISARLHGAIPAAGMRKPSALIGIDTRMSAAEVVGIPSVRINASDMVERTMRTYLGMQPINVSAFEQTYIELLRSLFKIQGVSDADMF